MSNGLHNGLSVGTANGLYEGLDKGFHNGIYENDIVGNPLVEKLACSYSLNGNSNKTVGIGNFTDYNGVTYGNGILNNCAIYNVIGSLQYSSIPANSNFNFGSQDFGVSVWAKKIGSSRRQIIMEQCNNSGWDITRTINIEYNPSDFLIARIFYNGGASWVELTNSVATTDNKWHNIILTRNGDNFYLILDNKIVDSDTVNGVSVNQSINNISIGRLGEYPNFYFSGYISNLDIWKKSIFLERTLIYNKGFPLRYPYLNKF